MSRQAEDLWRQQLAEGGHHNEVGRQLAQLIECRGTPQWSRLQHGDAAGSSELLDWRLRQRAPTPGWLVGAGDHPDNI
jgi:hypothetical protein